MLRTILALLFLSSLCAGQTLDKEFLLGRANEGAKLLYSEMRDPDSFKLARTWITRGTKHSDPAVCYEYYARNGYGGMNHAYAEYAPRNRKDAERDIFTLGPDDDDFRDSPSYKCNGYAHHYILLWDVSADVKSERTSSDNSPKN